MLASQEDKFYGKELVMGQAAEGAHGLTAALGLSDEDLGRLLQQGEDVSLLRLVSLVSLASLVNTAGRVGAVSLVKYV